MNPPEPTKPEAALEIFEPTAGAVHNLETVVRITGIDRRTLLTWCRHGIIRPTNPGQDAPMEFTDETLALIRQANLLRQTHDLNVSALRLITRLSNRIEQLETELRFLRD